MNAGLSNLDTLRKHLLASSMSADPRFDAIIQAIGLGVAGLFEGFTNRRLAWSAQDQLVFSGERPFVILPRYPVVAIAAAETRFSDADEWVAGDLVHQLDAASGVVRFLTAPGSELSQVRITWSGGYWFNTAEPDDDNFPDVRPAGATELPGDIRGAFLLQCEHVWAQRDKLGAGILDKPSERGSQAELDLVPLVKQMLARHIRYALA